jgi:MFS family permease
MIVVSAIDSVILASGNWRPLFYISFAPILVALAALVVLREPARTVELRRLKQGKELPSEMSFTVDLEKARHSEWRQIFASDLRRQTFVLIAGGFFIGFALVLIPQLGSVFLTGYNHLSVSMASLAIGISSLLFFVAQLTIGRLSDYFPARNLVIIATIAGCLGTGLLAVPGGAPVAFLAVILIGFTVGGIVGCWYRYVAESFPTRARGTGVLFIGAIFGLGSAVAPAIFGFFLNEQNFVGTALVGALVSLLAGLIILGGKVVAPRKELEEIHI